MGTEYAEFYADSKTIFCLFKKINYIGAFFLNFVFSSGISVFWYLPAGILTHMKKSVLFDFVKNKFNLPHFLHCTFLRPSSSIHRLFFLPSSSFSAFCHIFFHRENWLNL